MSADLLVNSQIFYSQLDIYYFTRQTTVNDKSICNQSLIILTLNVIFVVDCNFSVNFLLPMWSQLFSIIYFCDNPQVQSSDRLMFVFGDAEWISFVVNY
jgi:hypothetical protein